MILRTFGGKRVWVVDGLSDFANAVSAPDRTALIRKTLNKGCGDAEIESPILSPFKDAERVATP